MLQNLSAGLVLLAVFGSVVFSGCASAEMKGNLTVEVDGLQNQKGEVCLKVFSGSRGFPNSNESAVKRQCVKISSIPLTVTFPDLKAGSYAIAVFHDRNGDRILNRNSMGMPTEGYGFSKNPIVRQAPPQFGEAAIMLAGPNTRVNIQMRYGTN